MNKTIPFQKYFKKRYPNRKNASAETRYVRKNGIKGYCKTHVFLLHGQDTPHRVVGLVSHQSITSYKTRETELQAMLSKISQQLQYQLECYTTTSILLMKSLQANDSAESRLQESEIQFHLLAENATDIISRHTPDGIYLYVSPSCKTLLGYTAEDLLSRSTYKLIHYDDVGKVKKAFNRRKENSGHHHTLTYRMKRKEGDYRWFESTIRHIYHEKSRFIREIQAASEILRIALWIKKLGCAASN